MGTWKETHTGGMTEQEAESFAARLTRVWQSLEPFTYRLYVEGAFPHVWLLKARIAPKYEIEAETRDAERPELPFLVLYHLYENSVRRDKRFHILCTDSRAGSETTKIHIYPVDGDDRHAAEQWLPVFRGNCWLSGLPMEATSHEKAEWIQGFTHEELERWNLKV